MKTNYLFILIAASAVGKSVLINQIRDEGLWKLAPKYSTRDNRGSEDDVVVISNSDIALAEKNGDKEEIRFTRMMYIKEICGEGKGVVYYKNNNIYGIRISDVLEGLEYSDVAIIVSDFHAIRALKKTELGCRIKVIYLASTIDERELLKRYKSRETTDFDEQSEETLKTISSIQSMCSILTSAARLKFLSKIESVLPLLNEQWNNYVPYFDTIKTRSMNIRMLYNRYIDNIAEIDYAILNFYNLEYMFIQARNILNSGKTPRTIHSPPIFMVCAAPSSGKKTLMEIVGDLGEVNHNIIKTTKFAKRKKRLTDGRDGMIAIGKKGDFNQCIEKEEDIWSWAFHKGTIEYAVSHDAIKHNLRQNIAQIFISNMAQIENAKQFYPDNLVVLYLHATHETATREHIEEKRLNEKIDSVIESYKKRGDIIGIEDAKEIISSDSELQNKLNNAVKHDIDEIYEVHQAFLTHNCDIDHVLLNTGTREDLVEQMINLINYYTD